MVPGAVPAVIPGIMKAVIPSIEAPGRIITVIAIVTPSVLIRSVIYIIIPGTHPGIPVIIFHIVDINIGSVFNVNIHITVIGNMSSEFVVMKSPYAFTVLKILVFFPTNQYRVVHKLFFVIYRKFVVFNGRSAVVNINISV
jgi:hypothetical protein